MLRIRPFVVGHLVGAVMAGGIAGAFASPRVAFMAALVMLGGAIVSSLICQWRPGVDAAAWKLWVVAVLANPVMIAALGFMAHDWQCVVGERRGWDCIAAAMAITAACLSLLPPLGGLLWRWWKRRGAPAS